MALPDASHLLVYDPDFINPDSPDGCWLCTDADDVQAIQINAVCLPVGCQPEDTLRSASAFFESFSFVLVVGADQARRRGLAHMAQRCLPSVEVWETAQSVYKGCSSVRELRDSHGLSAIDDLCMDAAELPPLGILEISSVEEVDISRQTKARSGIPDLDRLIGGLYDGEVSVWTGKRKEGKSTLLGLPILSAIREGRKVCVYSGELPAWRYKAWLLAMAAGPDHLTCSVTDTGKEVWAPLPDVARQIDLWWKDKLFLLDNAASDVHQPEQILARLRSAHRRFGASVFVVDNLMTVELPGEDYNRAQSRFVGQLVDLAHETNAHVHLVAHRRKGGADKKGRGDSDDVSGSADITNRPDNTFAVSRMDADEEFPFSAKLDILANRTFGTSGTIGLNFDPRSRRFYIHNPNWLCGWETDTAAANQASLFPELPADPHNPFS